LENSSIEVELKYPIDCGLVKNIISEAVKLGYKHRGSQVEEDIYYQHPCRNVIETDEAIRVRRVNGKIESLTYKGPRLSSEAKARLEIIVKPVGSLIEEFLLAVGFSPAIRVVKSRTYLVKDNILVTVDNVVDLGCFVEIEVPLDEKDKIRRIADELGLQSSPLTKSYVELIMDEKKRG
jgi:adenylate cyclase class 2